MSADARFLAALADELARGRVMAEALAPLLSAPPSADRHDAVVRSQGLDLLVQRAVQFGVNNYLVKPFTAGQLKEKIEGVFGPLT